jgi:hypothetical protein
MNTSMLPDPTWLRAAAVKDGVMLGGLTEGERRLWLALAWAGLASMPPGDERAMNAALKQVLQGPLQALHIDHVELRRWLVDCGFVTRDGFGRRYAAAALADLPELSQAAAHTVIDALADAAPARWVQALRDQRSAERAARRARHAALAG